MNKQNKKNIIKSHGKIEIKAKTVTSAKEIIDLSNNVDVIGVDEAQFFSEDLVDVCNTLANGGIRVIVAGLDMDFSGKPFGPCLLYTSPSPRDLSTSRMPSSA